MMYQYGERCVEAVVHQRFLCLVSKTLTPMPGSGRTALMITPDRQPIRFVSRARVRAFHKATERRKC